MLGCFALASLAWFQSTDRIRAFLPHVHEWYKQASYDIDEAEHEIAKATLKLEHLDMSFLITNERIGEQIKSSWIKRYTPKNWWKM